MADAADSGPLDGSVDTSVDEAAPGFGEGGSIRRGRYRIGPVLGSGGMATVFRAHDLVLDRDVAVKVFTSTAASPEERRAQEAEARILASLSHPGLVRLFDAGVDAAPEGGAQTFLVMELVEGADLRSRLREGPLPLSTVAHLGFDLADALDYIHGRGITHRDIKPANVLLVDHAAERRPRVKLADFGVATLAGRPRNEGEFTIGTAAYLSPEQAEGDDAGMASDIYSLGLVLLEAVSGRLAFPGSVVESAFARLERQPGIPPALPRPWRELLAAMTARRPADRPDAADVSGAFRQLLVEEQMPDRGVVEAADVAADAAERAETIARYNIEGAETDPGLDAIVDLAAKIFHVQTAMVAVTGERDVWIRAHSQRRVGALIGAAPDAVLTAASLAVTDTQLDDRAGAHPLLGLEPGARFFASAPLTTHGGVTVGVLAVIGSEPRRFGSDEARSLDDLAAMAVHELEMRRAVRRITLEAVRRPGFL